MKGCVSFVVVILIFGTGCTELRGRRHAREGNRLYVAGNYAAAVEEYRTAAALLPGMSTIALNEGLACRQLIVPGGSSEDNRQSVQCALAAFGQLKSLRPQDPRGDQLYVQTLFDADRYETLTTMYQEQLRVDPTNLAAVNGLIQTYSRWNRWEGALHFMLRRAEIANRDAEAQYAVGVFIWNRLFQRGGHEDRAAFDPRPEARQLPPPPGEGDIVGDERARLADLGIARLAQALAIRSQYKDAMTYLNLLYRQKSYAFFNRPDAWQECVDLAATWQRRAAEVDVAHGSGH